MRVCMVRMVREGDLVLVEKPIWGVDFNIEREEREVKWVWRDGKEVTLGFEVSGEVFEQGYHIDAGIVILSGRSKASRMRACWLGREVEYRDSSFLRNSGAVYRGRVIEVGGVGYEPEWADVLVTYKTEIPIEYRFRDSFKDLRYFKSGRKFAWKEVEGRKVHRLRWGGVRWKMERSS